MSCSRLPHLLYIAVEHFLLLIDATQLVDLRPLHLLLHVVLIAQLFFVDLGALQEARDKIIVFDLDLGQVSCGSFLLVVADVLVLAGIILMTRLGGAQLVEVRWACAAILTIDKLTGRFHSALGVLADALPVVYNIISGKEAGAAKLRTSHLTRIPLGVARKVGTGALVDGRLVRARVVQLLCQTISITLRWHFGFLGAREPKILIK